MTVIGNASIVGLFITTDCAMLKIFLAFLGVAISVYWVGDRARRNPKIDAFLFAIEGNYSKLNERLEDATIKNGLRILRKFYGWTSLFLFLCLFFAQSISSPRPPNFLPLLWCFGFVFMGWFSIKWVLDHKRTITDFSRNNAIIVFGPLILGIFDMFFHTQFAENLFLPFGQIGKALHLDIPVISNPLAIGGAVSLALLVFFGFYYLLTWAVTVPIFLISVFAVLIPILFARALAKIDRNNTFLWFTFVIMVLISIWLTQL